MSDRPGRQAWAGLTAAWLGWVLDAFDFNVFVLVMPLIAKEFNVSITSTAASVTITLLFRLLGSFVAGAAADRWGRKLPLMISVVWLALADGSVYFAPSFTVVLILRTLFGFGMGAEWTAGATLAMESWPEKSRGFASGVLQSGWAAGYLLASIASAYVLPLYGWRVMFVLTLAPAILALPIRFFVTETHQPVAAADQKGDSRGLTLRVAWAAFILFFGFAVYFGLTTFLPTLLRKEHGFDSGQVAHNLIYFNLGMLIGAPLAGLAAVRMNPMKAIALFVGFAPFAVPLAVGWAGNDYMVLGAFLGGFFAGGPSGVTALWLSTLFPPWFRARGNGLTYHFAAGASSFVPFAVSAIAEQGGVGFGTAVVGTVALFGWLQVGALLLTKMPQSRAA